MSKFKRYLTAEIGIEFKAGLYFLVLLFFYSIYRIIGGHFDVSIVLMAEMIATTYAMGYVQVYLLDNFEEAEHFRWKEGMASFFCAAVYTGVSYLLKWFERDITTTFIFFAYMWFAIICAFLAYKAKREIDTALLNEDLEEVKKHKRD